MGTMQAACWPRGAIRVISGVSWAMKSVDPDLERNFSGK
jgi:hypothetical protein